MKESLENILRMIIREEIGRNFHTTNNMPYSFEDYPEIDVQIYPSRGLGGLEDVRYNVKIDCLFDPSLNIPLSTFGNEEEAKHFARGHADRLHQLYSLTDPKDNPPLDPKKF